MPDDDPTSSSCQSHPRSRFLLPVLRVAAVFGLALALVTVALPAHADLVVRVINTDGIGIASRPGPRLSPTNGYGAPADATITAICWTRGDPVGPHNNTLWWKIRYDGREFYAADRYLSTPYVATSTPSEPRCSDGTLASAPGHVVNNVWVGSPFAGTWAPGGGYSHPAGGGGNPPHHRLRNNGDQGQWAVDLGAPAGTPVVLYAAPQGSGAVTARVDEIGAGCKTGGGGSMVRVSFLNSTGARIGSATYAHINLSPDIRLNREIGRWGTTLGTVGTFTHEVGCWEGAHLHFEMFSTKDSACWNKGYGWQYGYRLNPTNFLGYTGPGKAFGNYASCP